MINNNKYKRIYKFQEKDNKKKIKSSVQYVNSLHWTHTIDVANEIGYGTKNYELISDKKFFFVFFKFPLLFEFFFFVFF